MKKEFNLEETRNKLVIRKLCAISKCHIIRIFEQYVILIRTIAPFK